MAGVNTMNRRSFLELVSIGGVAIAGLTAGYTRIAYDSREDLHILRQFIMPYTRQVGETVIKHAGTHAEAIALASQIRQWILEGNDICIANLNTKINADLAASQFKEIQGWVIPRTEMLISAVIVDAGLINGN